MVWDAEKQRKKLEHDSIRSGLVRAGVYLAGWELLKADIQNKVRGFFLVGFSEGELTYSPEYKKHVLALDKSRFKASLLWLIRTGGLTEEDMTTALELRDYRNEIAHELPKFLVDPAHEVDLNKVRQMRELLGKLGVFWGRLEVDINPEFDHEEVRDEDIQSGSMLFADLILEVMEREES